MPPGAADPQPDLGPPRRRGSSSLLDDTLERRWHRVSRYGRRARVRANEELTPTGTIHVTFDVVDDEPFEFEPGQFVGIQAKFDRGYRRSPYCIMSAPGADRSFELLVRIVADGPLSQYLGRVRPGDVVAFRGPTGRTMLPPDGDGELVLLATGVGLAPFLSLIKHLLAGGSTRKITLYWGLRLLDDICLAEHLDALARAHPNFSYAITLSQPTRRWSGLRGRITESVPPLIGSPKGKQFYLCGNGAMTEEMGVALFSLGVPWSAIYEEPYFNRDHKADPAVLDAIRSRFRIDVDVSPVLDPTRPLFPLEAPLDRPRQPPGNPIV